MQCKKCGATSCKDLLDKIIERKHVKTDIARISSKKIKALDNIIDIEASLPGVPQLQFPEAITPGLIKINNPTKCDPVLVTGNNRFTLDVLMTVLSFSNKPFFLLSADTRGDSLDMAVILETFTAYTVQRALQREGILNEGKGNPFILPGRAAHLKASIEEAVSYNVIIGPVCAAELPLFLGDLW